LDATGFVALPAKNVTDAVEVLRMLNREIDLLIINPLLDGVEELTTRIRSSQRDRKPRIIAISGASEFIDSGYGVDAAVMRPARPTGEALRIWLDAIHQVLGNDTVLEQGRKTNG
jgi:hypothetical protein